MAYRANPNRKQIDEYGKCIHAFKKLGISRQNPMGGFVTPYKCVHCVESGFKHSSEALMTPAKPSSVSGSRKTYKCRSERKGSDGGFSRAAVHSAEWMTGEDF